ncbi:BAHD acyltransferase DCR [Spatholobus suberectus]|nr:BAHD acyltransferase DCR [Spatholobus suberectus]
MRDPPEPEIKHETFENVVYLPILSCHYIQKGVLLTAPSSSFDDFILSLKHSLSVTLSHFSTLTDRLNINSDSYIHIVCNAGTKKVLCTPNFTHNTIFNFVVLKSYLNVSYCFT